MQAVPRYAQEVYGVLYNRFGQKSFTPQYVSWFLSKHMVKKVLYVLEKNGWIKRVQRGEYICCKPEEMVKFKVPSLLKDSKKPYCLLDQVQWRYGLYLYPMKLGALPLLHRCIEAEFELLDQLFQS